MVGRMVEGGRASRANGVGSPQLGWHTGGLGRPDSGWRVGVGDVPLECSKAFWDGDQRFWRVRNCQVRIFGSGRVQVTA